MKIDIDKLKEIATTIGIGVLGVICFLLLSFLAIVIIEWITIEVIAIIVLTYCTGWGLYGIGFMGQEIWKAEKQRNRKKRVVK